MSGRVYHLHAPGTHAFAAARPLADVSADTKFVNQHGKRLEQRNGYPSRAPGALLDKGQKAHLCILAREAFERVFGRAPHGQHEFDTWRRQQQERACGLVSLTDADQRHWPALQACFLDLTGESGRAFAVLMAPDLKAQRVALAALERNCLKMGLAFPAYPSAICRTQYKCALGEASPKQLWRLTFTVRNRGKTAKQLREEDFDAPF
jgi:hypothetical protein